MEKISLRKEGKLQADQKSRQSAAMFVREADSWIPGDWKVVLDVPLSKIIAGDLRFILQMQIDSKKMYLVSHEEDETAVRAKHPASAVINLKQLYGFFLKSMTDDRWLSLLPQVFITLDTFSGANVEK